MWEEKLRTLAQDKTRPIRSIATEMKADPSTIKRYLDKLNSEVACDRKTVPKGREAELSRIYADRFIQFLNENPQATRSTAREHLSKEYSYLYRHNRALLLSILPDPNRGASGHLRVDWEARDKKIFQMVQQEIQIILQKEPPQKVTMGRIGRNLNILAILHQHLDKLPRTKKLLEEQTESTEEFQIRRARLVVEQMQLHGEEVKPWIVYKKAGLGARCSEEVRQQVFALVWRGSRPPREEIIV